MHVKTLCSFTYPALVDFFFPLEATERSTVAGWKASFALQYAYKYDKLQNILVIQFIEKKILFKNKGCRNAFLFNSLFQLAAFEQDNCFPSTFSLTDFLQNLVRKWTLERMLLRWFP